MLRIYKPLTYKKMILLRKAFLIISLLVIQNVITANDSLFIVDDTNPSIQYDNFSFYSHRGRYNTSTHESEHEDASFEFRFSGNVIELIAEIQPWGGMANVFIDGSPAGLIDYNGSSAIQQVVYYNDTLSGGEHHITVTKKTSQWIYLDAYRHGSGNDAKEAPESPQKFHAKAISANEIQLSWEDASGVNESYFLIERTFLGHNSYDTIKFAEANSAIYTDFGLKHNTRFIYRISAVNEAGASEYQTDTVQTHLLSEDTIWVDDFNPRLQFSQGWGPHLRDERYMGTEHETNQKGEFIKCNFLGTNIEMVSGLVPWGGYGEVFINGVEKDQSCFSGEDTVKSVFTSDTLPLQRHCFFFKTKSNWNYVDAIKYYTLTSEPDSSFDWPYAFVSSDTIIEVYEDESFELSGYGMDRDGEIINNQWDIVYSTGDSEFYSDSAKVMISKLDPGFYHFRFKVMDNDSLEAYNVVRVKVLKKREETFNKPTPRFEENVKIYPVPSNGLITIESNANNDYFIEIYTATGQKVYNQFLSRSENKTEIDLSPFKGLVFFIKISCGEKEIVRKVIVKQ